MSFNEDSRVKIPTLLHLTRLGYKYVSLCELEWDKETNFALSIFYESIQRLNPKVKISIIKRFSSHSRGKRNKRIEIKKTNV